MQAHGLREQAEDDTHWETICFLFDWHFSSSCAAFKWAFIKLIVTITAEVSLSFTFTIMVISVKNVLSVLHEELFVSTWVPKLKHWLPSMIPWFFLCTTKKCVPQNVPPTSLSLGFKVGHGLCSVVVMFVFFFKLLVCRLGWVSLFNIDRNNPVPSSIETSSVPTFHSKSRKKITILAPSQSTQAFFSFM